MTLGLSEPARAEILRIAETLELTPQEEILLRERLLPERQTPRTALGKRFGGRDKNAVRYHERKLGALILSRLSTEHREEAQAYFSQNRHRRFEATFGKDEGTAGSPPKDRNKAWRERWYQKGRDLVMLRLQFANWFSRQPPEWRDSQAGTELKTIFHASDEKGQIQDIGGTPPV